MDDAVDSDGVASSVRLLSGWRDVTNAKLERVRSRRRYSPWTRRHPSKRWKTLSIRLAKLGEESSRPLAA
jgi:hypothetical protein